MSGRLAPIALAAILTLAGCEGAPAPTKPAVVVTVYPLWELARPVAGDRAEVVSLVPPGVEPHDWEPSARDTTLVQRATVLHPLGNRARRVGRPTADGPAGPHPGDRCLDRPRPAPAGRKRRSPRVARPDARAHAGPDDRERARAGRSAGGPVYLENAAAFAARLDALDQAFAAGLRDCARRELVTSHAAFAYLARRYGLTQVPVMGLAPEAEPSPADLAAIVQTARRLKVTHVFFEPLMSPRLAQTLAREIGATTLPLDPIEGVSREQAAAGTGYVELMQGNLANLRVGLGCR